jgi:23S rRNA (adenine2503-C2)-methyltransferase
MSSRVNLLSLSVKDMSAFIRDRGWPRFRAHQILRWLYQGRVRDIEAMTDLPKAQRNELAEHATINPLTATEVRTAHDGTQKFFFSFPDGGAIESVLIPDENRLTLCLSTQVGCSLDCTFCLTGQMGLQRNLKPHEIIGQVQAVQAQLPSNRRLSNLVLMGMGEPLANVDAVEEALHRLTNTSWGLGFPSRRITLSTAGLAPRLKRVSGMGVNLAVSLNATTPSQRARLMPAVNRAYSLETLLKACRAFPLRPHRRLTFEYVLLKDENDSEEDAKRLAALVSGIRCKINLIPFNEFPGGPFRRPSDHVVLRFQSIVAARGLDVFIRKSKGREILGACGQLGTAPQHPSLIRPTQLRDAGTVAPMSRPALHPSVIPVS